MFDENQIVKTKWTVHNRKQYIELGYNYTEINDTIHVLAKHLCRGSKEKVKVICDKCGKESKVQYNTFLKAKYQQFCSTCARREAAMNKMKSNTKKTIQEAKELCDAYGYKLLSTEKDYNGRKGNISFECPIHGEQTVNFQNFRSGHKCYWCAHEQIAKDQRLIKEEIIRRIESVEGNKLLNPDDYIDIFEHNLLIKCKCGNVYTISLQNYKHKHICDTCANSESSGERRIKAFFEDHNIVYEQEKRFVKCRDKIALPFDFYLPTYNMCIEYDGEHHYWNVFSKENTELIKKHDTMKNEYCEQNGIKLLRIPYFKKNDIENILKNELQVEDIV